MAEETINEVIERVTVDLNRAIEVTRDRNVKFTIHAGDATKLLDELETVCAERDAIAAEFEAFRTKMYSAAPQLFNTQPAPQAEWTPREGMRVQVKATGERGTIFMHVDRYYQWRVQFTNGELKDHSTDELELAD